MDMLRYHRFTIGWAWPPSTARPTTRPSFRGSSHARRCTHPQGACTRPLVATADHDDRVVPAPSFKYAATLQSQGGPAPILIRIETRAGHGAGKPVSKLIDETADVLAFLENTVGSTR